MAREADGGGRPSPSKRKPKRKPQRQPIPEEEEAFKRRYRPQTPEIPEAPEVPLPSGSPRRPWWERVGLQAHGEATAAVSGGLARGVATARKSTPGRPRWPPSQQTSDIFEPFRRLWRTWRPESLWPADVVEKALGEGMYRTLRRPKPPEGRFQGNPKAQAEYELYSLLGTLRPEHRDYIIHRLADRAYSGPIRLNAMARRIVDEGLYLSPKEREKVVQRILDEEESPIYEGVGKTLWDPLMWATLVSWKPLARGIASKIPLPKVLPREKITEVAPRIAEAWKWGQRFKPILNVIDDTFRWAMGYSDDAVRLRVITENLSPEAIGGYCDMLGLSEKDRREVKKMVKDILQVYRMNPDEIWEYIKELRAGELR